MADVAIVDGIIKTAEIKAVHTQIKELVLSYKDVNFEVEQITKQVRQNWVGKGRNEFETQYNILIKKIDDFGETLQEIYDALVDAEAQYADMDDNIRQEYVMAMK